MLAAHRRPIRQRILAKSSISCVVKLGYSEKKHWYGFALDRVNEIVSSGHLIVWPLGDQEQSQGELDLLLEKFDRTEKPCSVVQLNWHLLADPTHYANGEAAKRYQLFDSIVRRSFATLKRFWLSCNEKATPNDERDGCNGLYHPLTFYPRHCPRFFIECQGSADPSDYYPAPAPLRSTDAVATLLQTLADLLNTDGELKNLRDLIVQWPILHDDDFKRPTLGGVMAAAPKLRNLFVNSCSKLIEEEFGALAAAYMRTFDDFYVQQPVTALELQRLSIGEDLADYVDSDSFFDSIVELTAPKLRRIDFLTFSEVQEYDRESGRYRLLPSVNTLGEWFGAGTARRQMTPGSERPTAQRTCRLFVSVEEKDGAMVVYGDVGGRWDSKKAVLDQLVRANRECVAQPRHLQIFLQLALPNDFRRSYANDTRFVPFHTKDFDGFDMVSLNFFRGVGHKVMQSAVASLDSAWRKRVWKLEIAGNWQDTDESWHDIYRLLDALPGVRRIDLLFDFPWRQGRRRQRELSVRVAAFIDEIESDGTWKFKRFWREGCREPDVDEPFYERSPRGIERAFAHCSFFKDYTLQFVRAGVTRQRWLSERGLVKPKGVETRYLIN